MMKNAIHSLHVLVVLIFMLCIKTWSLGSQSLSKDGNVIKCIETEREALLLFRQGAANKYGKLDSWNKEEEEDCCKWKGVGCNNRTGHVTHLLLSSLLGIDIHISNSLLDLPYLSYLDLSNNYVGEIPDFFGSLTNLVHLDLYDTWIFGPIPSQIANLSNLQYLDLSRSSKTAILSEGVIPHELGNLCKLQYLNLHNRQLNGTILNSFGHMSALNHLDLSANQLDGKVPNSIWNLSSLKIVDFSSNNFTGSLPDFILLSSLKVLRVNFNQFEGYVPTFFGNRSALKILDLSNNHLRGSLPDFTGFSSLESLYLDNNELSGSLPNFTGLSSLSLLHLSNNAFSGSLPDFMGCSSLVELGLADNQLTEWGSQSTGLLSGLVDLNLAMNSIHGTISEAHLSNLSSLVHMDTSFNSLTFEFSSEWLPPFQLRELSVPSCKLGPKFPNWIRNQQHIVHLDISNSQISDTFPIWLNLYNISYLNLSSNNIRGNLSYTPDQMLRVIDLSSNSFDGPLPPIPSKCREINLSQNKFSGTLLSLGIVEDRGFTKYNDVDGLTFLDLSHNQLSGAVPDYWMLLSRLGYLNLGYNNFSGRIPPSIGTMYGLQTLILRNNKLYGELPENLRNCLCLGFVDFGLNKLSGEVPSWIGEDLPQLYALVLKSNRFNGSLPSEICQLSNLHFLDLSMNRISGSIPTCFGDFTAMIEKGKEVAEHVYYSISPISDDLSHQYSYTYVDSVLARWKGQEYEYGSNFAYLKVIDLSTNNLTGEIPIGITSLLELKGLNLSENKFYGKVPPEIGKLKELEFLDLSTNKFSGEIPPSMSGLSFLAFLNLSNNNFSGKIPLVLNSEDSILPLMRGTPDSVVNH